MEPFRIISNRKDYEVKDEQQGCPSASVAIASGEEGRGGEDRPKIEIAERAEWHGNNHFHSRSR